MQYVRNAPFLSVFRQELKTILFRLSFPDAMWQCMCFICAPIALCWSVTIYWLLQTDFVDIVRWSCSSSAIMPHK